MLSPWSPTVVDRLVHDPWEARFGSKKLSEALGLRDKSIMNSLDF